MENFNAFCRDLVSAGGQQAEMENFPPAGGFVFHFSPRPNGSPTDFTLAGYHSVQASLYVVSSNS